MRGSSLFHLPLLKRWHTLHALIRSVHNGTAMPHLLVRRTSSTWPTYCALLPSEAASLETICLSGPGILWEWHTPMLASILWYSTTKWVLSRRRGTGDAAGPMAPFADY